MKDEESKPMSECGRNLTPVAAALQKLGCRPTRLCELINAGIIKAYKMGHATLVDADSINQYHNSLPQIRPKKTQSD